MILKPWRDVVTPHPDVAGGRYRQAEFGADLAQVLSGRAEPEYQDPVEFYQRTYITGGMKSLLVAALERVAKKGGEPVVQLKTAFGGQARGQVDRGRGLPDAALVVDQGKRDAVFPVCRHALHAFSKSTLSA